MKKGKRRRKNKRIGEEHVVPLYQEEVLHCQEQRARSFRKKWDEVKSGGGEKYEQVICC